MYKKACKEALNFIRPMIIGKKYYGVNDILNDIGTEELSHLEMVGTKWRHDYN